jgi:hypothetical protein
MIHWDNNRKIDLVCQARTRPTYVGSRAFHPSWNIIISWTSVFFQVNSICVRDGALYPKQGNHDRNNYFAIVGIDGLVKLSAFGYGALLASIKI